MDCFINRLHKHITPKIADICSENKLLPFIINIKKKNINNQDAVTDKDFLTMVKALYNEIPKIVNNTQTGRSVDDILAFINGDGDSDTTKKAQKKKPKKAKASAPQPSIQASKTKNAHATPPVKTVPTADLNTEKPVKAINSTKILAQITPPKPQETLQAQSVFVPKIDVEALVAANVAQTNAELDALKANSSQETSSQETSSQVISAQDTNSSGDISSNDGTAIPQMPRSASTFSLPDKDGIMRPLSRNTVTQIRDELFDADGRAAEKTMRQLRQAEAERSERVVQNMKLQNTVREQQKENAQLSKENAKQQSKHTDLAKEYQALEKKFQEFLMLNGSLDVEITLLMTRNLQLEKENSNLKK